MATAADVPGVYDVVINGQGYVFLDSIEPSLPFRTHRASYSLTPTFINRQNVSGDFGDNQQDFYLTYTQNDWSLGEDQRYFRTDDVRSRKYWLGNAVRIDIPGEVTILPGTDTGVLGESIKSMTIINATDVFVVGATHAYQVSAGAIVGDLGAHGLGADPADLDAATCDSKSVYFSTDSVGIGVRKYAVGGTFTTFAASGATSLCFLNNTLFGFRNTIGDLVYWDSAGTLQTAVFTWKNADGTPAPGGSGSAAHTCIRGFGSEIVLLRRGVAPTAEVWIAAAPSSAVRAVEFPAGFTPYEMVVSNGFAYISGYFWRTPTLIAPIIFSFNGSSRLLSIVWESPTAVSNTHTSLPLAPYKKGIAFFENATGRLIYYDATTQAISTIATLSTSTGLDSLVGTQSLVAYATGTTVVTFPSSATASSAFMASSLIDFDSSLSKRFKAVKVDFDPGSDGDGGSIDISYQLNSVDGSYVSLVTGAVAGSEYAIDQSGRSISIKITLNKGTSTYGPKLKRIYLRGVPIQPQFRLRSYVLDVTGSSKKRDTWIKLRSGRHHTKDGMAMAADLLTAVAAQTPITITDRLGTFTGIIQPDQFEILEVHPGEFVAQVVAREV